MSGFLSNKQNPEGFSLEQVLLAVRKDLIVKTTEIVDDDRPQAQTVLENDIKIIGLLTECLHIAEASSKLLKHSFGPHVDGQPRIGTG